MESFCLKLKNVGKFWRFNLNNKKGYSISSFSFFVLLAWINCICLPFSIFQLSWLYFSFFFLRLWVWDVLGFCLLVHAVSDESTASICLLVNFFNWKRFDLWDPFVQRKKFSFNCKKKIKDWIFWSSCFKFQFRNKDPPFLCFLAYIALRWSFMC